MTKPRKFHSLQVKFIIVLLLALAVGLGCAALVKTGGDYYIDHVYLSATASAQRCQELLDQFGEFVDEEQISAVDDSREIIRWVKNQDYLYLLIESLDGSILIDSGWWDEDSYYTVTTIGDAEEVTEETESADDTGTADGTDTAEDTTIDAAPLLPAAEESTGTETDGSDDDTAAGYDFSETADDAYGSDDTQTEGSTSFSLGMCYTQMEFADGTYEIYLYDFSDEPLYDMVNILSYATAIAVFIFIMLFYHQSIINQIIKLSKEVEHISNGDLEGAITVRSMNEIGVLAQHVDLMRTSIIQEMRAEQEAWNANSDLITRMSHDIRTPLTILLGFLDLLDEGSFSEDENYRTYLGICQKNANQLKQLADKLFQYFLVFGHRDCELKPEVTDAQVLLDQLIGEHQVLLEEQGWEVENRRLEQHCLIRVDPIYGKRLIDNLFSNIEKYADPEQPVVISQTQEERQIHVVIRNAVAPNPNPVESTKIGLKTCERIVEQMGGVMRFEKTEQMFTADFTVPIYREEDAETKEPEKKFLLPRRSSAQSK